MATDLLPVLYQKVADITGACCASGLHECKRFSENRYRCCERRYCDEAARFALHNYGIQLQETGNPDLPFMGKNGCTVAPHLRPICALHVCMWSWAAKSHVNHNAEESQQYKSLYDQILEEAKRQGKEPPINFDVD